MATLEIESRTFRYQRYVDDLVGPRGPGPLGDRDLRGWNGFSLTLSQLSYVTEPPAEPQGEAREGGARGSPGATPGAFVRRFSKHKGGGGPLAPGRTRALSLGGLSGPRSVSGES